MKNEIVRKCPAFGSMADHYFGQLCAVAFADFVSDDFPGIQIHYGPDIVKMVVILKHGDVADPDLVRRVQIKALMNTI